MKNHSGAQLARSIVLLLIRIWRHMPWLTSLWLAVPLLLGVLVIPGFTAQRDLVDLFVSGTMGREWKDMLTMAWIPLTVFTGVALLRSVFGALQNMIDVRLRDRASLHIQTEVHTRAASVPLERMDRAAYYDRLQRAQAAASADLLGVLQNGVALLRLLFEWIALVATVSFVHPLIGLLLGIVCIISFSIRLESEIVVRRLNRDLTYSGRQADYLHEAVMKPETVKEMKIFGSMDYLIQKWAATMRHSLNLRMGARRREIRHGMIVSAVQIAGLFGAIAWMVFQLKSGGFTAGMVVIVFQAMRQAYHISSRIQHPVSKIYIQGTKMIDLVLFLEDMPAGRSESGVEAVRPLKAETTAGMTAGRTSETSVETTACRMVSQTQIPGPAGRITFEDVSYRYPGASQPTLQQIRLVLNPGETVALVGENGAGKSTLVKLLLSLYQPTGGTISWDGVSYDELDVMQLRSKMSAVFQDFVKYETTVRDNIGFGMVGKIGDDDAIRHSLQLSGAGGIVNKLDGGLGARIGMLSAGGRELSGGQWQRLAIARAAMREAQLLVLDEPTAALDPQHETELYQSFVEMAKGRSALFVSHRLGWARYADRIIVLRDGRIAEEGTHGQLLAAGGLYAAMFRAQAQWYGAY